MSSQPWSNAKVGTIGCSSTAEWQPAVAALSNPKYTTMIVQGFGAGIGRVGPCYEQGSWYRGGGMSVSTGTVNAAIRLLPVIHRLTDEPHRIFKAI